MSDLLFAKEVYKIVGAAFAVYNELGAGFLESVYQEALELELGVCEVPFVAQAPLRVKYKESVLKKEFVADVICFGAVLVELKAMDRLSGKEEAQLLNYLKATGLRVGILINFGNNNELEWKRFVL